MHNYQLKSLSQRRLCYTTTSSGSEINNRISPRSKIDISFIHISHVMSSTSLCQFEFSLNLRKRPVLSRPYLYGKRLVVGSRLACAHGAFCMDTCRVDTTCIRPLGQLPELSFRLLFISKQDLTGVPN